MKYCDALQLLKNTGDKVEFILSQLTTGKDSLNVNSKLIESKIKNSILERRLGENVNKFSFPLESYLIENYHDGNVIDDNKGKFKPYNINIKKCLEKSKCEGSYRNSKDFYNQPQGSNEKSIFESCFDKSRLESFFENPNIENCFEKSYENTKFENCREKHTFENCHDISNVEKCKNSKSITDLSDVPYHKHIRYEIDPLNELFTNEQVKGRLNKSISKSCNQIYSKVDDEKDRARVVDFIPKSSGDMFWSLDRRLARNKVILKDCDVNLDKKEEKVPPIALPRSFGLSRKWRGPVKYPVTPIKKTLESQDQFNTNSDEEQVFI